MHACWQTKHLETIPVIALRSFLRTKVKCHIAHFGKHSVVTRGHIISFEVSKKRKQLLHLVEIELPTLEQASRVSLEDDKKILNLKYKYNQILSQTINKLLLKAKKKHFELGDKPQRLLSGKVLRR